MPEISVFGATIEYPSTFQGMLRGPLVGDHEFVTRSTGTPIRWK